MAVLSKTTVVVRQKMVIFNSRTIEAVAKIVVGAPRNAKNVPRTSGR